MMGPAFGTEAYNGQVETIVTAIGEVADLTAEEFPKFLMMYITDTSFSRAAICEAENRLRKIIAARTNTMGV